MRKLYIILAVALLCVSAQAQEQSFLGGEFGMLIQQGEYPKLSYAITKNFSLEKVPVLNNLLGPLCQGWEGSAFYSDRPTDKAGETYATRLYYYRALTYKGWFVGGGVGEWLFVNTDGADVGRTATKAGFGYARGPAIFRIAGDIVNLDGNDLYFVHAGLLINL